MQLDWMPQHHKNYIVTNTNTKVRINIENLDQRFETTEVKELAPAGVDSGAWYRKINSKRYLLCIW